MGQIDNGGHAVHTVEMAPKGKRAKTLMSDDHKAALALGREQGRVVRQYLEALEQHKPKRGRKRTPESIGNRLTAIEAELGSADPLSRVHLIQERMDLNAELASKGATVDLSSLEAAFPVGASSITCATRRSTLRAWRKYDRIQYAASGFFGRRPTSPTAASAAASCACQSSVLSSRSCR